jgi:cobyrinic acid a,c-diamide synthase
MSTPTVVVAAAQSGAGKTTAALALVLALRARGLRVQPFKVGPDYLDASLLTWAAGRPCRNLDAWMLPEAHLLELFHRACRGADLAVVEGVMGLFDGRSGESDEASTAHVARLLQAPVALVLDARASARTVGAVALGLAALDRRLGVAGAILNRVAGPAHLEACLAGLRAAGVAPLGQLRLDRGAELPGRYLGLVSADERAPSRATARALREAAGGVDLDAVRRSAATAAPPAVEPRLFPVRRRPPRTAIAVARDAAFSFYYQDSLDLLSAWGAELVPFSPLADAAVPEGAGGVYLGGGYPELHAADLAANVSMARSLRAAQRRGAAVLAECGGAMYAGAGIEDADGRHHRMVRLWPAWTTMRGRRLVIGYREVRAGPSSFLHPLRARAHEFHYARELRTGRASAGAPAWEVLDQPGRSEGWAAPGLVASYIHLHLGACEGLAGRVVAACGGQTSLAQSAVAGCQPSSSV